MKRTHKSLIVASFFRVTAFISVIVNHREAEGAELRWKYTNTRLFEEIN
jgi:hypothetical protein